MRLKLSKIKRGVKHFLSMKALRKKIGLTGGSRHFRQLKRSIKGLTDSGSVVASSAPTSASTYQHQSRSLSQLMGGV